MSSERDAAALLARIITLGSREVRRDGIRPPEWLEDLRNALVDIASGATERHAAPNLVAPATPDEGLSQRITLSPGEVATACGVGERTVDRWLASGELPSTKQGGRRLIRRADVEEFIDRRSTAA